MCGERMNEHEVPAVGNTHAGADHRLLRSNIRLAADHHRYGYACSDSDRDHGFRPQHSDA